MKKFLIVGAALAASIPAAAMAQDGVSWSGGHVDAIGGWDQFKNDDPAVPNGPYKKDGVTYGGQAGFDVDTGSVVIGAEGEYSLSTAEECGPTATTTVCLKAGRDLYAGARVGVPVGDNRDTLLYLKGGYTNARFETEATTGGVTTATSFDDEGYRVGAGVEHRFSENMSAKVEYRYSDYGDFNSRNQVIAGVGIRF